MLSESSFGSSSSAAMKRNLANEVWPLPNILFPIVIISSGTRSRKGIYRSPPTASRRGCTPEASTAFIERKPGNSPGVSAFTSL